MRSGRLSPAQKMLDQARPGRSVDGTDFTGGMGTNYAPQHELSSTSAIDELARRLGQRQQNRGNDSHGKSGPPL